MRFMALEIDFDGMIATNDALDPNVRRALSELRRRDITVINCYGR